MKTPEQAQTEKVLLLTLSALSHLTEATCCNALSQALIHKTMDFRKALEFIEKAKKELERAEESCKQFIVLHCLENKGI